MCVHASTDEWTQRPACCIALGREHLCCLTWLYVLACATTQCTVTEVSRPPALVMCVSTLHSNRGVSSRPHPLGSACAACFAAIAAGSFDSL